MSSTHNLLVLSDIHLGSDLVHHTRPEAPERGRSSAVRDRDLVAFLDWYREHTEGGRPWRLVIAGDFVDFVGMSVSADAGALETELTDEERSHGLGGAADHARCKLRLVAAHHASVFSSLARFVAAGHTLVVLRGNHDVDLHWESVQREFHSILASLAPTERGAIEFAPWFYYEQGLVYIEHGHQYDPYCSYEHVMHPVSPRDRRRTSRSLSDVLLRYVVRPTRGLSESGHDSAGVADYVRFAAQLGWGGMLGLARRFLVAVGVLLAIWRAQSSSAALWIRGEHERKMRLLAEAKQISLERLRALANLQRPPVTRSLLLILASVMLDRIVVAVIGVSAVVGAVTLAEDAIGALVAGGAVGAAMTALGLVWSRARTSVDPSEELRCSAPRVAHLFPAAFVVMGHTHLPEVSPVPSAETTYVNLGAWSEEDTDDGSVPGLPATRTHLVVRQEDGRAIARLLTWDSEAGPRLFRGGFEANDSPFTRG